MSENGKALIVHDDHIVSRVAAELERYCRDIALFRRIISNDAGLPDEYYRVNKECVRHRLEATQWALSDLIEDIEDGLFLRELEKLEREFCREENNEP